MLASVIGEIARTLEVEYTDETKRADYTIGTQSRQDELKVKIVKIGRLGGCGEWFVHREV
jgi:hypothetical protein